jgi:peptidoglycan hydrolase-like amidase
MTRMSRGNRLLALAVVALLVLTPTGPASADDPYDVPDDATVTIRGDGSGHGRGMSQYGAYSAARQGVRYRAILQTYYPKTRWKKAAGSIEVLVSRDDDNSLVVGHHKKLTVRSLKSGRTWQADARGATRWRVTRKPSGVNQVAYFNGRWRSWKKIRGNVQLAVGGGPLTLFTPKGKVRYRGALRSAVDDRRHRVTVNVLPLEQYLRGVVPSEMRAATWPQQALRAQAVASRTYAAWRRNHPLDVAYDICDTALCQVYGGASAEYPTSDKAVRATAREILTFRRRPAFAEYSASNGGYTVSGGTPYLPARKDPYEGTSKDYYGWTVRVTAAQMEAEYNYDDLDLIAIEDRDGLGPRGGRVLKVRVTAGSGFTDTITGEDFRRDWGLPSTLFTITRVD